MSQPAPINLVPKGFTMTKIRILFGNFRHDERAVTALEFELYPAAELYAGMFAWPW